MHVVFFNPSYFYYNQQKFGLQESVIKKLVLVFEYENQYLFLAKIFKVFNYEIQSWINSLYNN